MLRNYQQAAVDAVLTWQRYKDTPAIVNLPTGSGKSHVMAALIEHYHSLDKRVLLLANRKELLEQTGSKINVPIGYYSASIGEKVIDQQITVAGIQSIYNKDIDPLDIIIVDECNALDNTGIHGQYWTLINKHPQAKLVGLSATPYRLKGGKLGWGEEVYKIGYHTLLEQGYLAPISNKLLKNVTPNLEKVEIKLGEYVQSQLEHVMEDPELIRAAVEAIIDYSHNRHSCLIFCVSVKHGELIAEALKSSGIEGAIMIDGATAMHKRESAITQFKEEFGNIRYLINCELFLIGFDAPNVDMIVCLRPTKSKALWEQMMGRGVRVSEGKANCLLVDMAGNLQEHGPIGSPFFERSKKEAPLQIGKICPECEEFVKPAARECPDCGYIFPEPEAPKVSHNYEADTSSSPIWRGDIQAHDVERVTCKLHMSKKGNQTIRFDYHCSFGKYGSISAWMVKWRIEKLFKEFGYVIGAPIDTYSWDDLLWHCSQLKTPSRIVVDHKKDFPEIIRYEFDDPQTIMPKEKQVIDLEGDCILW